MHNTKALAEERLMETILDSKEPVEASDSIEVASETLNSVAQESQNAKPAPSQEEAEAAVQVLLRWIGEDVNREGLLDTPKRFAKAYKEMFAGYNQDPQDVLGRTFEEVGGYSDMVCVQDIPFYSHCEHHMVPIIGKAHVAYMPNGRVLGLSKIARVVDIYAKRLQTQENMTAQIAQAIQSSLEPEGVAVIIEAQHLCMSMRGISKSGSTTKTSTFTGVFKDVDAQMRFIAMINGRA